MNITKEQMAAMRDDALRVNLGDPVVIIPSTTVLSLLDTIERYREALQHCMYHDSKCPIETSGDDCNCHAEIAREALNPKEGV